jgi:hypothetical protein
VEDIFFRQIEHERSKLKPLFSKEKIQMMKNTARRTQKKKIPEILGLSQKA